MHHGVSQDQYLTAVSATYTIRTLHASHCLIVHVIAAAWLRLALAENTTWLTLFDDRYYGLVLAVAAYCTSV
jgi:hypothetical protein